MLNLAPQIYLRGVVMKSTMLVLFSLLFYSIVSLNLQAQTVGKIFSKSEATTLFGQVIESKNMSVVELKSIISQTNNYVMFLIKDGSVAIKGDGGKLIYNERLMVDDSTVFYKCSKSILNDLLVVSNAESVIIEKRPSVVSITANEYTLEWTTPCPPDCD
jgi:hypothetical protein